MSTEAVAAGIAETRTGRRSYRELAARARPDGPRAAQVARAALPVLGLGYRRLSLAEQKEEGLSFELQAEEVRRYQALRGWEVGALFEDVESGRHDDRAGYQALLAEAQRQAAGGRRVAITVIRLDRLGRKLLEQVRAREELKGAGVATHSTREGGEVNDLTANVLATVAQNMVDDLSTKIRTTRAAVLERGWLYPGRPPFGYAFRPATPAERALKSPLSVADAHPAEGPLVEEAYRRAAAGASVYDVGRWLADVAPRPPASAKARARAEAKAKKATTPAARAARAAYNLARGILSNPVYIRRPQLPARGQEHVTMAELDPAAVLGQPLGRWPALVDDATWLAVQRLIASRRPRAGRTGAMAPADWAAVVAKNTEAYPLSPYLVCPVCGGPMHGELQRERYATTGGEAREYVLRRYRCTSRVVLPTPDGKGKVCTGTANAQRLERAVAEELAPLVAAGAALARSPRLRQHARREWERLRQEEEAAREQEQAEADPDAARARADEAEAGRLRAALAATEQARLGLTRKFSLDQVTYDDYRAALAALTKEREGAERALEVVERRLATAAARAVTPGAPGGPPAGTGAAGPTEAALEALLDRWAASPPPATAPLDPLEEALAADGALLREALEALVARPTTATTEAGGISYRRVAGTRGRGTRYGATVALSDAGRLLQQAAPPATRGAAR